MTKKLIVKGKTTQTETMEIFRPLKQLTAAHTANLRALELLSRKAADAKTPEERDALIKQGVIMIDRGFRRGLFLEEKRSEITSEFRRKSQKDFLEALALRDPMRAIALNNQGAFDRVDPVEREQIIVSANDELVKRAERERKREERELKQLQDSVETEIEDRIARLELDEARAQLDLVVSGRLLPPPKITRLRKLINNPGPIQSDRKTADRILLDVESIEPTVTLEEIDDAVDERQMSLSDALTAKATLRATLNAIRNEEQAELVRRHAKAEQKLRAMTGVSRGIVASALSDDPAARVFARFLPELHDRSLLFGGTEDPIDVVRSFRPFIRDALESARFKSGSASETLSTQQQEEEEEKDFVY